MPSTSKSITRQSIADRMVSESGLSLKDSSEIVDGIIDLIRDTLAKGDKVMISGFGRFETVSKKGRKGRNPRTGVAVQISARKVLKFRPSNKLKETLNAGYE